MWARSARAHFVARWSSRHSGLLSSKLSVLHMVGFPGVICTAAGACHHTVVVINRKWSLGPQSGSMICHRVVVWYLAKCYVLNNSNINNSSSRNITTFTTGTSCTTTTTTTTAPGTPPTTPSIKSGRKRSGPSRTKRTTAPALPAARQEVPVPTTTTQGREEEEEPQQWRRVPIPNDNGNAWNW